MACDQWVNYTKTLLKACYIDRFYAIRQQLNKSHGSHVGVLPKGVYLILSLLGAPPWWPSDVITKPRSCILSYIKQVEDTERQAYF